MLTVQVNQKYNKVFRGVYFLRIREKSLSQISYSKLFSSSNVKVSNRTSRDYGADRAILV